MQPKKREDHAMLANRAGSATLTFDYNIVTISLPNDLSLEQ